MMATRPSFLQSAADDVEAPKGSTNLVPLSSLSKKSDDVDIEERPLSDSTSQGPYRTYRRRFLGLAGLIVLNIISAVNWVLFSTITHQTSAYFHIPLTKVNWLSNIVCALYLVVSWFVPTIAERRSIAFVCRLAALFLAIGGWLRYAAAFVADSPASAYALLFLGSVCVGFAQPALQIVGPAFSETWFTPRGRTTSTMLVAVANPFGGAVGDLLAPAIVPNNPTGDEMRTLLLVIGIATSVCALAAFGVGARPPSPPSFAAGSKRESLWEACRIICGLPPRENARQVSDASGPMERGVKGYITARNKIDFFIIVVIGGILIAFFDAYSTFLNQIYAPYGYSSDASGFFGAASILCGLIAAAITAPIFDRYLTHHFAIVSKIIAPLIGVAYLGFIWAVKEGDYPGIYFLNIMLGICSFILLPIALELCAEVSSTVMTPDSSSAIVYLVANGLSVVFIVAMDALRDGADASPPLNMRRALIFQGVIALVTALLALGLKGEQQRRRRDEEQVEKK